MQKSDRDRDRSRENDDRYPRGRRRSSPDREKEVDREKSTPSAHIMVRGSASALTKEDEVCSLLLTISYNSNFSKQGDREPGIRQDGAL